MCNRPSNVTVYQLKSGVLGMGRNETLLKATNDESHSETGILLTPPGYTLSTSRRGKPDSGWPVALRHDSCPEAFSSLTGAEREAVSRVNIFVKACAEVVLEAITAGIPVAVCHATSSYMWSLDIYRCLLNLGPAIAQLDWCGFGSRFPRRTTIWSWNLDIPSVLPRCLTRGDVCSFSHLTHQKGEARAARNLSYPWRLRDSMASWFLSTWEQNALLCRWNSCRRSIPEYGNSGSVSQ